MILTKHCHERITERLGVTAENIHEQIVSHIEAHGSVTVKGSTTYFQFGNCEVRERDGVAVTFIRRK